VAVLDSPSPPLEGQTRAAWSKCELVVATPSDGRRSTFYGRSAIERVVGGLFEREEAILYVMRLQITSEKRRNPWTSVLGGGDSLIRDPGEREAPQPVDIIPALHLACSREIHCSACACLGARAGARPSTT
jgi:hypothetical protein